LRTLRFPAVALALFLVFCCGVRWSHSALSQRQQEVIRIAYMNGYMDALKMEPEKVKKLKQDKEKLRWSVEAAAQRYLNKIEAMNR